MHTEEKESDRGLPSSKWLHLYVSSLGSRISHPKLFHMTGQISFIHKSTKNLPEKTIPLNHFILGNLTTLQRCVKVFTVNQSKYSLIIVFHFNFFSFQVSGGRPWSLKNPGEPSFSSSLPNRVTHWPVRITTPLRKRLRKTSVAM